MEYPWEEGAYRSRWLYALKDIISNVITDQNLWNRNPMVRGVGNGRSDFRRALSCEHTA